MYRFRLEAQGQRDYEVYNWFTATHPSSYFVQNLVAARITDDVRFTLFNRVFAANASDGRGERATVTSAAELHEMLSRLFGLEVDLADIEKSWPRLLAL